MSQKTLMAAAVLCASFIADAAQATLVISTAPTSNVTCSGGTCTATGQEAVLNVGDLTASLQQQNTIVSAAMPIEFDAPMPWTSPYMLSLDAYYAITFTQPVVSQGRGGFRLLVRKSGDFYFTGKGRVAFWDTGSILIINGIRYTLANSLATLNAAMTAQPYGHFALSNNYDASADGTYSHSPITANFGGTFEGLGNGIGHLSMSCCGMFGYLPPAAPAPVVRDISLVGVILRSTSASHVGALVGWNYGGLIIGASVSGLVSAGNGQANTPGSVGGVVGLNQGGYESSSLIRRAHSSARVSCGAFCYVGGVVGDNQNRLEQSAATGSVRGGKNSSAGGIAGRNYGSITLSFATGAVSVGDAANSQPTRDAMAGGLVGFDDGGLVDHAYATGPVAGGSGVQRSMNHVSVGGLVGGNSSGTLRWCYAMGPVSVGDRGYAGGLSGSFDVSRTNSCYSTGAVSVTGGSSVIGGLTGEDTGPVSPYTTNYWDLDTSGVSDPSQGAGNIANDTGIAGLTTSQFQSGLPFGFDAADWVESPGINNGLPYLRALPPQ